MAANPNNPFGDESIDPLSHQNDESLQGIPTPPSRSNPPLPEIQITPGPESAPIRRSPPPQYQASTAPPRSQHRHPETREPVRPPRKKFNWKGLVWFLVALPISGLVCFYLFQLRQEMAEETRELSFKPAKARLALASNEEWQDLGFHLNPGDQIAISASGSYFNSAIGVTSGEGASEEDHESVKSRSYDPLFPHGCVIARTRTKPSEVFHIGAAGIIRTEVGGRLQVRVNDLDLLANRGKLILEARTYYKDPPNGETFRGVRDSEKTPISR